MVKNIKENGRNYRILIEGLDGKTFYSVIYHIDHQLDYTNNSYGKDFCEKILSVARSSNGPLGSTLKCKAKDLLQRILEATKFLDDAITDGIVRQHVVRMSERVYCILNDITEIPTCTKPDCKKVLANFEVSRRGDTHYEFCCKLCAVSAPSTATARARTFVNRPEELKEASQKQKENTCQDRYGAKQFMKSEYFQQKQKEYIVANGGTDNVSQIPEVRAKVVQTNLKNCGYTSNLLSPSFKEERALTWLDNYDATHPMKNEDFAKQFFDKFEAEHGCRNPFQLETTKKSTRIAVLQRCIELIKMNQHVIPLFELNAEKMYEDGFRCWSKQYWWQCLDCGHVFAAPMISVAGEYITTCPFCQARDYGHSKEEKDLVKFLHTAFPNLQIISQNNSVNRHIIAPYEIDVWIPEKKIGIEFDGVYWHSIEALVDESLASRGLKKTMLCENQGIHLIHVYEDEWLFEQEKTKALLVDLINGKVPDTNNEDLLQLPLDKYSLQTKIPGYQLEKVLEPKLVPRGNAKEKIYHVMDCGQLIFKRTNDEE